MKRTNETTSTLLDNGVFSYSVTESTKASKANDIALLPIDYSKVDTAKLARFGYQTETPALIVETPKRKRTEKRVIGNQRDDESLAQYLTRKADASALRAIDNRRAKENRRAKVVNLAIALQVANAKAIDDSLNASSHVAGMTTDQTTQLGNALRYFAIEPQKIQRHTFEHSALHGAQRIDKTQAVNIAASSVAMGTKERESIIDSLTRRFSGFSKPKNKRRTEYESASIVSRFTDMDLSGGYQVATRVSDGLRVTSLSERYDSFTKIHQTERAYLAGVKHGQTSHSSPLGRNIKPLAHPLYHRLDNTFTFEPKPLHLPMWHQKRDVTSTIAERMEHSPSDSWSVMTMTGYRAMSSKGASDARKVAAQAKLETPTELYPTVHSEYALANRELFERKAYRASAKPALKPAKPSRGYYEPCALVVSMRMLAGVSNPSLRQNGKVTFGK